MKISSKKGVLLVIVVMIIAILISIFVLKNYKDSNIKSFNIIEVDNNIEIEENEKAVVNESKEEKLEPVSFNAVIPIYMYHWIKEDTGGYEYPEMMVKPSEIRKQFEYLSTNGYDTIFITDLKNVYDYKKPVALTFDDGWADVYYNVYPYAQQYNVKISMYVINNFIGTPGYCTIEQLKEMKESGLVDIQAHTVTHRKLGTLSKDEAYNELLGSKDYLKEQLGIDTTVICYPSGSYSNSVIESAKNLEYEYGLAMDGGIYYINKFDEMEIPRIFATRSMSLQTFINYASKASVEVKWE